MIDWNKSTWTKGDCLQAGRIADKAMAVAVCGDRMSIVMDLEAANMACPLDLDKLEGFGAASLVHDVYGIGRHLNRETGELENCFMPRCAA